MSTKILAAGGLLSAVVAMVSGALESTHGLGAASGIMFLANVAALLWRQDKGGSYGDKA